MSKQKEKIREFSRMPKKELLLLSREKKEKLRQLRFDLAAGKIKNVREIREVKKEIAQLFTLLKKKQ